MYINSNTTFTQDFILKSLGIDHDHFGGEKVIEELNCYLERERKTNPFLESHAHSLKNYLFAAKAYLAKTYQTERYNKERINEMKKKYELAMNMALSILKSYLVLKKEVLLLPDKVSLDYALGAECESLSKYFKVPNYNIRVLPVEIRSILVEALILPIVENAFAFNSESGEVNLNLEISSDDDLLFEVSNGPLLHSHFYEDYILNPHIAYSLENSLKHKGVGLSLSVSKMALESLGGDLSIEKSDDFFRCFFKLKKEALG